MFGINANLNPPPEETRMTPSEYRAQFLCSVTPEAWDAFMELVQLTHKIDTGEAAAHLAAIQKATLEQQQGLAFADWTAKRMVELDELEAKLNAELKWATEEKTKWSELRSLAEKKHAEMQSILGN